MRGPGVGLRPPANPASPRSPRRPSKPQSKSPASRGCTGSTGSAGGGCCCASKGPALNRVRSKADPAETADLLKLMAFTLQDCEARPVNPVLVLLFPNGARGRAYIAARDLPGLRFRASLRLVVFSPIAQTGSRARIRSRRAKGMRFFTNGPAMSDVAVKLKS